MEEDRQLIEEYLSGSGDAIEGLVTKYQKMVYSLAYRLTNDMDAAQDLTQETFIKVLKGINAFKMKSSFKTWVYRIATNVCLNRMRKRNPETMELDEAVVQSSSNVLTSIITQEQGIRLNRAIHRLTERQKLAVTLRTMEGLSCRETADIMGCSEGAVKAHYHNGVKRLKEILKES
jgi:RNA polymerase sigma-70 factor (ECF subfamily)